MNKMDKMKRNALIITVALLLVLITGVTYAIYNFSQLGTKENVLTTGTLNLSLAEGTEISLSEAIPILDSDIATIPSYDFTLTNTGSAIANYQIYIDNVAVTAPDVKLDDSFIKYSLTKDGVTVTTTPQYLTSLGADGSRVLDSGTITSSEEFDYSLKIWVTADIDGDISGQVWQGKVRIEGEQLH